MAVSDGTNHFTGLHIGGAKRSEAMRNAQWIRLGARLTAITYSLLLCQITRSTEDNDYRVVPQLH